MKNMCPQFNSQFTEQPKNASITALIAMQLGNHKKNIVAKIKKKTQIKFARKISCGS